MRKLIPFLLPIVLSGCMRAGDEKNQRLQDTLTKLRIKCDFRPLDSASAYAFINKYYLPLLDSSPTKRKIFIHPLRGENFKEKFKRDSIRITNILSKGSKNKSDVKLLPPPPPLFNANANWNQKRFERTQLVNDKPNTAMRREFGKGYMSISYPLYNSHTKRLLISEYLENGSSCGTGRDMDFWFQRTENGWHRL